MKFTKEMLRLIEKRDSIRKKLSEINTELEAACTHPQWSTGTSFHNCLVCGTSDYYNDEQRLARWEELKKNK